MQETKLDEIIKAVNGRLLSGNSQVNISSICIDSREIFEGSLFVPIVGDRFDGHDFVVQALLAGSLASFVNRGKNLSSVMFETKKALIEVEDTVIALQSLARYCFSKFKIPVVGITGSVGKSTVKEMCASILESTGACVLKTHGNFNGQIGLPLSVARITQRHDVAVLEMGVSIPGEMEKLTKVVAPDFAIVTNIGMSHLENMGNVENIFKEKIKVAEREGCRLFFNGDSEFAKDLHKNFKNVTYFGISSNFSYHAEQIVSTYQGTEFLLVAKEFREIIEIPCFGVHSVCDALAAIAFAVEFGIGLEYIKKGLANFQTLPMRQQIKRVSGFTIIDDSYNASPDSIMASFSVLKNLKGERKIAVISDMLELGPQSEKIHFDMGKRITQELDLLITFGNFSKLFCEGAKIVRSDLEVLHFETASEAAEELAFRVKEGDVILVKGSRAMHSEEVVEILQGRN
ncbi:MAG: UDP-N-acetylmuramoyl-tripeptide--D-alanyl-D-alanine ligase [Oscillospiraceae bacterium]|jgi:UDP-N-acetylmuramoyl-tripeptide--D-alanyl-D-alanine ligase|nr:UDP-N-acetylmuramoyl-tripeptide--D-alanyl-D-alanine ligase [Oscillospiraceae bacterium]